MTLQRIKQLLVTPPPLLTIPGQLLVLTVLFVVVLTPIWMFDYENLTPLGVYSYYASLLVINGIVIAWFVTDNIQFTINVDE